MKNLLIATTALVATAGIASAEVTFTGKGEAGMYQTGKTKAVVQKYGVQTTYKALAGAIVVDTASTTAATAATVSTAKIAVANAKIALRVAQDAAAQAVRLQQDTPSAANAGAVAITANIVIDEMEDLAEVEAELAVQTNTAVAAKAAADMVAYSGYDMNVALSAETDSGIVFGMGFDMGAGLIADQNDDRAMDSQGAVIGTSALTATMSGYKLSIGSDKLDDVYDDSQNGDIGLSGNVGGIAFNLVHDLTDEVVASAASYAAIPTQKARTAANPTIVMADSTPYLHGTDAATPAVGDSDYVGRVFTAAKAATVETTSLSLGGATGAISYTFAMTTGNDAGDSAAKGSVTYTGMENLALTLAHDNAGKLEGISKVTVAYTMGDLKATLSMADDKDHKGNKNKSKKASSNLSLAYAANGLAATFATDESSQWWVNTQYDLGGGAQVFATIDHTEFAVVGLNFNF